MSFLVAGPKLNTQPFHGVIDTLAEAWYTPMESKLVYRNSDGVRRTSIVDSSNPGELTVLTEVVMDSVIENNKIMRELHPRRSTNKLVARGIPLTVYEQSVREDWDDKRWNQWLNDPDNAVFRIWQGWIS